MNKNQHTISINPCLRKKDLQETHDKTSKLFPRALSPQIEHRIGILGAYPYVNFFRPILLNSVQKISLQINANIFFSFLLLKVCFSKPILQ